MSHTKKPYFLGFRYPTPEYPLRIDHRTTPFRACGVARRVRRRAVRAAVPEWPPLQKRPGGRKSTFFPRMREKLGSVGKWPIFGIPLEVDVPKSGFSQNPLLRQLRPLIPETPKESPYDEQNRSKDHFWTLLRNRSESIEEKMGFCLDFPLKLWKVGNTSYNKPLRFPQNG